MSQANLTRLFGAMPTVTFPEGSRLFRGDWADSPQPQLYPGAVWFHSLLKGAAGYVNFGRAHGAANSLTPVIFEVETTRPLRLLRYQGNHIEDFYNAYGKVWEHSWLRRDCPAVFAALPQGPLDGFFMQFAEGRAEYLIMDSEQVVKVVARLIGQKALEEADLARS